MKSHVRDAMRLGRVLRLVPLLLPLGLACSRPGGPGVSNEFGNSGVELLNGAKCLPLLSAEVYPARSIVTHPGSETSDGNVVFTSDLYARFNGICGGCHVSAENGNFVVSQSSFSQSVTQAVVDLITSSDPNVYMPPMLSPNGKAYSARTAADPVVQLVNLLELWIQQGSPPGQFYLSPPDGGVAAGAGAGGADAGAAAQLAAAAQANYALTPDVGASLTNVGTCLPNRYVVGSSGQTMDQLDTFFAQATALPGTLAETDLTTLDSDALARSGVVSYVPAYPLWSDDAGKMRYVRTPHNQPIVFDKSTQQFQIPPNTRFYKTFLKKVIDSNGRQAYQKIETRLIVSRPDTTRPDGTVQQNALFGTYLWNDTETAATLLQDPLRDGLPFTDRVITYVTDAPRAQAIAASTPPDLNLEYYLDSAVPPVRRHYGVPGSTRCVECHMGSPSASFVLGFLPLQIATVAPGTSGVIEPATGDELTQLQRLIDYKVISGMTSPADVIPLENSQLPRTPRNAYELTAQAYMLGNCAHCHNPRGFPSTKAPALKDVLDFLPGPNGGIFQFPLDRTSPVRSRGVAQNIPIPYITPSLRDIPEAGTSFNYGASTYTPKYVACPGSDTPDTDGGWCTTASNTPYVEFIDAPWRSLIYRNVDTPFDYVDDLTIFPHMPMNTPGYDCRVTQIMGDWMVSIPAVDPLANIENNVPDNPSLDLSPQPYTEVLPTDPAFASAQAAAQKRLAQYHAGRRYNFCPDTSDIVDPAVSSGAQQTPADHSFYDDSTSPPQLIMPSDGVPDRPNWVVTDETDPPGPWFPRGTEWPQALVQHIADATGSGATLADLQTVIDDLPNVKLDANVRSTLLTPVPFALWQQKSDCDFNGVATAGSFQGADRPVWMDYKNIDPAAPVYLESPGAAVFTNICINCHGPQADGQGLLADEIALMTGGNARVADFRSGLFGPVSAPGTNRASVFTAAATATTVGGAGGGDAGAPVANVGTPDDYGARYMAWMALGGTKVQIPSQLLQVVATTQVAGVSRSRITITGSPDMLQLAQKLCTNVLLSDTNNDVAGLGQLPGFFPINWSGGTALIGSNGDAELWMKVCNLDNRPVVRVLVPGSGSPRSALPLNPQPSDWDAYWSETSSGSAPSSSLQLYITGTSLYWGDAQGSDGSSVFANWPVMDQRGQIRTDPAGITPDNLFPMCVREPPAANAGDPNDAHTNADAVLQATAANTGGNRIPYCPPALFTTGAATDSDGHTVGVYKWRLATPLDSGNPTFPDANNWALRGAINAGLAVFLYIDQLSKTGVAQPLFNQCELLTSSGGP
jgi:mono/diheme cytochrome c family protein